MEHATWPARVFLFAISAIIIYMVVSAQRGKQLYIRRIPGLTAIDEAVGRATEMGRSILLSVGLGGIDIVTLQALAILRATAQTRRRGSATKSLSRSPTPRFCRSPRTPFLMPTRRRDAQML